MLELLVCFTYQQDKRAATSSTSERSDHPYNHAKHPSPLFLPLLASLSSVLLPDITLMLNRSPICVAAPLKQKQTNQAVSTPVMAVPVPI